MMKIRAIPVKTGAFDVTYLYQFAFLRGKNVGSNQQTSCFCNQLKASLSKQRSVAQQGFKQLITPKALINQVIQFEFIEQRKQLFRSSDTHPHGKLRNGQREGWNNKKILACCLPFVQAFVRRFIIRKMLSGYQNGIVIELIFYITGGRHLLLF